MKNTFLAFLLASATSASAAAGSGSIYKLSLKDIDKKPTTLREHKGKALLVVNVASECGLTPQYAGLEALHGRFKDRGFAVLGFPCNQFGGQEPGTNEQIKTFCSTRYQVTFPMFDKIDVKGANQHPLFKKLAGPTSKFPGDIGWNFGKFLIGKNGEVIARFDPSEEPESEKIVNAIEKALAGK